MFSPAKLRGIRLPAGPIKLDRGNRLTQGLLRYYACGAPGSTAIDVIGREGIAFSSGNTANFVGTPYGLARVLSSTTPDFIGFNGGIRSQITNQQTWFAIYAVASSSSGFLFGDVEREASGYNSGLYINASNQAHGFVKIGGTGTGVSGTTVIVDGLFHVQVQTYDGASLKMYVDGRLEGTTAVSGNIDAGAFSININRWGAASTKSGLRFVCGGLANRAWTDDDVDSYTFDPAQIIERSSRIFFSAAAASGALTQDTRFDNSNTFYAPTVSPGAVALTPGLFSNTNTFYSPTVTQADQALTQDTRFDNAQTFYAATVTPGAVALTPALFTNAEAFYAPTVTSIYELIQASRLDASQIFYAPTVTPGSAPLTQDTRFDNAAAFYAATITGGAVVEVTAPTPAGSKKRRRRERYVARYRGEDHEFESLEALDDFLTAIKQAQAPQPKRARAPVRITLTPEFVEELAAEVSPQIPVPARMAQMPPSVALAQARKIDAAYSRYTRQVAEDEEDEDALLWLI